MLNIITVNIIYVVKSILSQGAPLARAYLGFYCKKRLEVSLLPQDGMLIHHKAIPPPALHQASLTICHYPFKLLDV